MCGRRVSVWTCIFYYSHVSVQCCVRAAVLRRSCGRRVSVWTLCILCDLYFLICLCSVVSALLFCGARVVAVSLCVLCDLYILVCLCSVVSALLSCGALVDAVSLCGRSALFVASESGHIHCVKELLESGADRSVSTAVSVDRDCGRVVILSSVNDGLCFSGLL